MSPDVSIVIPSYKPDFFEQSLKSAIGQTYANIKIFVYDNCPSNEIEVICNKYPTVHYFRNNRIGSLNVIDSIYIDEGYFIKPLFDDDILHPFCVERMVKSNIENHYGMVFSASAIINKSHLITKKRRPFTSNVCINSIDLQRTSLLNLSNYVGELSSIMFRKDCLVKYDKKDVFKYNKVDIKGLTDLVFYFNITQSNPALYIDEELSYFRVDSSLLTNSTIDPLINPNFIYAITDWIDLLINANKIGIISNQELIDKKSFILDFIDRWSTIYKDSSIHKDLFLQHISLLI